MFFMVKKIIKTKCENAGTYMSDSLVEPVNIGVAGQHPIEANSDIFTIIIHPLIPKSYASF